MVDKAETIRDKALIMSLYESGNRVSEFLNWCIKDLTFDEFGCKIRLSGKTGARIVRCVGSAQIIKQWIELEHPLKNKPNFRDTYVWVAMDSYSKGKPLGYEALRLILKECGNKANIKKKINPHAFRASRATFLASRLPEHTLKAFFGWVPNSSVASHYVFLSGKEVDSAILKINGLNVENGSNGEPKIREITCLKCRAKLSPNIKICQCGMPTDPETAQKIIEKQEIKDRLFKRMLSFMDKDKVRNDEEATELWKMLKE